MMPFAIVILAVGSLLVCLSAYRSYLFNSLTYSELLGKIRAHRRLYNYMNEMQRNSRYGKGVSKSIVVMEARLKKLANAGAL